MKGGLKKSHMIQLILAIVFTLGVFIVPTVAWFSFYEELGMTTKIISPVTLEIKSGGKKGEEQSIVNFELSDIDTEDKDYPHYTVGEGNDAITYYYKDFVFCVKGRSITEYDLQLAHTTNIAFQYDIYRAQPDDAGTITYTSLDKSVTQKYSLKRVKLDASGNPVVSGGALVYEPYDIPLDGEYVNNANGNGSGRRVLAKDGGDSASAKDLTARNYDQGSDQYQKYANPVYWLKRKIRVYDEEKNGEGFTHSYVLRVSWVMQNTYNRDDLQIVQNNKETDIIYITAAISN